MNSNGFSLSVIPQLQTYMNIWYPQSKSQSFYLTVVSRAWRTCKNFQEIQRKDFSQMNGWFHTRNLAMTNSCWSELIKVKSDKFVGYTPSTEYKEPEERVVQDISDPTQLCGNVPPLHCLPLLQNSGYHMSADFQ